MKRALVLLVLLCASALAQTLNVGLDVDPGTMDPRLVRDTSATRMQDLIFNGLVRLDPKLKPVPDLALSWKYVSATVFEMKLRQGVVFHDGQPFTAEDVVYTYSTVLDTAFNSPRRSFYTPITKIEAVDPLTVRFTLSAPFAPLLQYLTLGIVPKGAASSAGADFGSKPVGTGPFRFVSWQRGSRIELAANDKYFRGRPKVDGLSIRPIPDNNVRLTALESGDLQFIHSPVPPQDLDRLAKNNRLVVSKVSALGYTYLNINTKDPILSDKRVRQALAYLTDRATIAKEIFFGMDTPGDSFLIPGTDYYTDNVTKYNYDPAKANQLLTAAGWVAQGQGIREKNGRPLTIELVTNIDPNRQQVLEFLQGEWRKAGIEVKVRAYDFAAMLNDLIAGKYQISLIGLLNVVDPDAPVFNYLRTGGANNWGKYSNPIIDKLAQEGRTTTNIPRRKPIYAQVARIATEEVPFIFLLYQGYVVIRDRGLEGYVVYPTGSWYSFESVTYKK